MTPVLRRVDMESLEYQRGTCPMCFGPLAAKIDEDQPGRLVEVVSCKFCGSTYYWPEHQWCEPAADPAQATAPEVAAEKAMVGVYRNAA
jgi:uncharacterized protein with PIN domain